MAISRALLILVGLAVLVCGVHARFVPHLHFNVVTSHTTDHHEGSLAPEAPTWSIQSHAATEEDVSSFLAASEKVAVYDIAGLDEAKEKLLAGTGLKGMGKKIFDNFASAAAGGWGMYRTPFGQEPDETYDPKGVSLFATLYVEKTKGEPSQSSNDGDKPVVLLNIRGTANVHDAFQDLAWYSDYFAELRSNIVKMDRALYDLGGAFKDSLPADYKRDSTPVGEEGDGDAASFGEKFLQGILVSTQATMWRKLFGIDYFVQLTKIIAEIEAKYPPSKYQLAFTGFSMGGAMAQLGSMYMWEEHEPRIKAPAVAFGSPAVKRVAAEHTSIKVPANDYPWIFNFYQQGDIIPMIDTPVSTQCVITIDSEEDRKQSDIVSCLPFRSAGSVIKGVSKYGACFKSGHLGLWDLVLTGDYKSSVHCWSPEKLPYFDKGKFRGTYDDINGQCRLLGRGGCHKKIQSTFSGCEAEGACEPTQTIGPDCMLKRGETCICDTAGVDSCKCVKEEKVDKSLCD